MTVKLMYCHECKIHTNHHKTKSGEWVCWCGAVEDAHPVDRATELEAEYKSADGNNESQDVNEWLGEG